MLEALAGCIMATIDLKLLRVFLEIYETKSITQAAIVLGLSQPTISIYLSKLRQHYDDPLFVRSSRGMEPTPFAQELTSFAHTALASIDAASNFRLRFAPEAARRSFHIAMTDISQITLLPLLLDRLASLAPHVDLDVSHISGETRSMLESGEVDVAIGHMPQLETGFYQQKMFAQRYVVIASHNHPRITDMLTLAGFLDEGHARVNSAGTGHFVVEQVLLDNELERRVCLDVPNYLGLLEIIARSALIAVVPQGLTRIIGADDRIRILELPAGVELPTYQVKQHWHERNHRDSAHRWLRGVVASLFVDHLEASPGEEILPR